MIKTSLKDLAPAFNRFLLSTGFFNTYADPSLYTKTDGQTITVIVLYVHDIPLTKNCRSLMAKIQADIRAKYKVRVGSRQSKFLKKVIEDVEGGSLSTIAVLFRNYLLLSQWTAVIPAIHTFRLNLGHYFIQAHRIQISNPTRNSFVV